MIDTDTAAYIPSRDMHESLPEWISQLREARRVRHLTQAALARQVGCQQSAVSMLEAGRVTALSRETLQKLAALLEVRLPVEAGVAAPPLSVADPAGRAFCPDPGCPTNIPFVVNGVLLFWPQMHSGSGAHCAACGEVLASGCPKCGAPARGGACCRQCGTALVSPPESIADVDVWAAERGRQLAAWRALRAGEGDVR